MAPSYIIDLIHAKTNTRFLLPSIEGVLLKHPLGKMHWKLSFCDWCISILSSKKWQTPIILADLLGNESLLQRVQKVIVCDLWSVDFDPFCEFLCFKVRCLWSYCDQNPTLIFQIFQIDFIPGLPIFREAKILKIQINFWDRKSAIKCRVLAELSFPHASVSYTHLTLPTKRIV